MSMDTFNTSTIHTGPGLKPIKTGSFSADDDLRGAPLSEFHISHENDESNTAAKLGAALAVALVIGGIGAYSFLNSSSISTRPSRPVVASNAPMPSAPPVAAPAAPAPMDSASTAPSGNDTASNSDSSSVSSPVTPPQPRASKPAPVVKTARVVAPAPVETPAPVQQQAATTPAPVFPAPDPSAQAVNGNMSAPELTPSAQSSAQSASPAPDQAQTTTTAPVQPQPAQAAPAPNPTPDNTPVQ